jgi:hypothetical protein
MRYSTSREEVEWIVKYWPTQWKVSAPQKKGTKSKDPAVAGTSKKTSSPTENTKKVAQQGQASGSRTSNKNPRKKEMVSRKEFKGDGENDISHLQEVKYGEKVKRKIEAQTSTLTKKRTGAQEAETRKNMNIIKILQRSLS